ncbi:PP2C family protein-serine/threonine phosphatase, partial [Miniimonas arenae]|uniref:PP2C family protein-serine/threonine phosphatase n=2 Tax=Miniimonas TaxID=947525 RepID=UPI0028AE2A8F
MTLAFSYAARSDVGLLRTVNQDSGYAGPHLLVLADGMGGPAGGDVASSVAIAHLAPLDGESHAGDALALLRSAVADAHAELRARAAEDTELAGLGTTLIAALRTGKRLAMVHIGDSRAYLVRDGQVSRLTADHTYVQHLVDIGQLTEAEAENHPHRSVILRVLGDHDFGVELDESVRELAVGDRFLLCSDGVSSFVSADTVNEALLYEDDPAACAERLVDLALRAGGPDNITAVVADVVELDDVPDGAAPSTTPQVVGAAAAQWGRPTR